MKFKLILVGDIKSLPPESEWFFESGQAKQDWGIESRGFGNTIIVDVTAKDNLQGRSYSLNLGCQKLSFNLVAR
ncbi:MAG: hypothetical protein F9B45_29000 [Phycisphaera sp. RhM]|nr:hypothetical protein [Phycisphaera sp. RhM]